MPQTTSVLELLYLGDDGPPSPVQIARDEAVAGRGADCDVRIEDAAASRRHFRLVRAADGYELENLSPKGTRVNGKTVERRPLKDGDVIQLGAATRLKVRYLSRDTTIVGHASLDAHAAGGAFDESAESAAPPAARDKSASVFRRPKILIGLGVYFMGLLLLMLLLESHEPAGVAPAGLPRDEISRMMQDYLAADSRAFLFEDDGITRRAASPKRRDEALAHAREAANTAPVSMRSMWRAVTCYRDAQSYDADGALRNPDDVRRFRDAREKLTKELSDLYVRAVAEFRKGRHSEARQMFTRLRDVIPDRGHPLAKNVSAWIQWTNRRINA